MHAPHCARAMLIKGQSRLNHCHSAIEADAGCLVMLQGAQGWQCLREVVLDQDQSKPTEVPSSFASGDLPALHLHYAHANLLQPRIATQPFRYADGAAYHRNAVWRDQVSGSSEPTLQVTCSCLCLWCSELFSRSPLLNVEQSVEQPVQVQQRGSQAPLLGPPPLQSTLPLYQ